ncbi:NAD kinase [Pelagibacterium luteolum]|uniref:NAD kinase n=1 Tax=Pelagibacterium luteolum TaxID=440168 RepID=A0A1G7XHN5_9HYPH|nr:NAD kinase [Pelagibacterium luteolum]SDG83626.1 NAD+ kinase [Pelagibacterium luteolum]
MALYTDGRVAFIASDTPDAQEAREALIAKHGNAGLDTASIIVALGGDGLMLETLHKVMDHGIPVYGMNFGSVGFLMNEFRPDALDVRLRAALPTTIHPLKMRVTDANGRVSEALALNEVSLYRSSYQAAKIEIRIDGELRLDELICDGVIVATPAGSTAYNLSAHGPILPITAPLLALTPISPFRPRRWRGAIISNRASIAFRTLESAKRPVSAVADNVEFDGVIEVEVHEDRRHAVTLLFDPGHGLDDRVLVEQFRY